MNYYEHHIGDYAEATAHLTFVEDAAYTRMIRKYYAQEKPLPVDVKAVQRLIGARAKEEREAVETVLGEFFELQADGWHNGRCDAEIARYLDKTEDRQAKREAEKERQRRHRERRKELFEALREYGEVPPFETTTDDLVTMLSQVQSQAVTQPVTRDATATQTPDTSHQTPEVKEEAQVQASTEAGGTSRLGDICKLLRKFGINTGPAALAQHAWPKNPNATDNLIETAIETAKQRKPLAIISVNYLRPIIDELLNPPAGKGWEPVGPKAKDWE
jgi:uncharacterized protein YdaU (DUF1376 family)